MRVRITSALLTLMSLLLAFAAVHADEVEIETVRVTEQIAMLTGKGGNIGLFTGEDGTFLIDDQFAPLTDKIIAAIKATGGDVPKFLINTHYHGDHTGGNENLGKAGTLIVSHDNVRERLSAGSYIAAFDMKRASVAKQGLPVVTFSEDISFHLNGDTVRVIHTSHAHTDGDSFIYFEAANVIHAGDIFFNGFYPFIDVQHGGSVKGMIAATDKILALSDNETQIIAGHGPVGNREDLAQYRLMLATAYELLRGLKEDGRTAQEAIAANPLADFETEWGDGLFKGDRWIELIYPGVY